MTDRPGQAGFWARLLGAVAVTALISGCNGDNKLGLFKPKPEQDQASAPAQSQSVRLVERDTEAPEIFQETDQGLWDGRPSLGGVWVAHSDVKQPERVIIRNVKNSKFVIGALFRRERDHPGPKIQVSSDAAAALGMLAGAPELLNVTALRREEVPQAPAEAAPLDAPSDIEATALDPVAGAAAAIERAEAAPAPQATAPKLSSPLEKPFIQIGIFSVEQNARNTATAMQQAGMIPVVKEQSLKGKTYWRVLVGPLMTKSDMAAALRKVKSQGFSDAYAVSN